jgi:hypothetical protein
LALEADSYSKQIGIIAQGGVIRVALHQRRLEAALAEVEILLPHLDNFTSSWVYDPLQVFQACIDTLRAVGESDRADEVARQGNERLERALEYLADEALRRDFLAQVRRGYWEYSSSVQGQPGSVA